MMQAPQHHPQEDQRLAALQSLGLLDTPPEERFDKLTLAAKERFNMMYAALTLIDAEREWFKSCAGADITEGPRDTSFCGHALVAQGFMVVEDALKDERFKDNPQVTAPPYVRFYAGMALFERKTFFPVGVFCMKDNKPRTLSADDIVNFIALAQRAEDELNSPRVVKTSADKAIAPSRSAGVWPAVKNLFNQANLGGCRLCGE